MQNARTNDMFPPELECQAVETPPRVNGLPLYIGPTMVFFVSPDSEKPRINLNASLTDNYLRKEAVERVLGEWTERELFACLKGPCSILWREGADGGGAGHAAYRVMRLDFTPKADLVIVDFLVRQGMLTPFDQPHFTGVTTDLGQHLLFLNLI
ncbi:hypothetical protein HK101_008099 [Irineochytrium annulatum]|nr:hypothetical protein HK101_008099 [Irineochytrium annulatum]